MTEADWKFILGRYMTHVATQNGENYTNDYWNDTLALELTPEQLTEFLAVRDAEDERLLAAARAQNGLQAASDDDLIAEVRRRAVARQGG